MSITPKDFVKDFDYLKTAIGSNHHIDATTYIRTLERLKQSSYIDKYNGVYNLRLRTNNSILKQYGFTPSADYVTFAGYGDNTTNTSSEKAPAPFNVFKGVHYVEKNSLYKNKRVGNSHRSIYMNIRPPLLTWGLYSNQKYRNFHFHNDVDQETLHFSFMFLIYLMNLTGNNIPDFGTHADYGIDENATYSDFKSNIDKFNLVKHVSDESFKSKVLDIYNKHAAGSIFNIAYYLYSIGAYVFINSEMCEKIARYIFGEGVEENSNLHTHDLIVKVFNLITEYEIDISSVYSKAYFSSKGFFSEYQNNSHGGSKYFAFLSTGSLLKKDHTRYKNWVKGLGVEISPVGKKSDHRSFDVDIFNAKIAAIQYKNDIDGKVNILTGEIDYKERRIKDYVKEISNYSQQISSQKSEVKMITSSKVEDAYIPEDFLSSIVESSPLIKGAEFTIEENLTSKGRLVVHGQNGDGIKDVLFLKLTTECINVTNVVTNRKHRLGEFEIYFNVIPSFSAMQIRFNGLKNLTRRVSFGGSKYSHPHCKYGSSGGHICLGGHSKLNIYSSDISQYITDTFMFLQSINPKDQYGESIYNFPEFGDYRKESKYSGYLTGCSVPILKPLPSPAEFKLNPLKYTDVLKEYDVTLNENAIALVKEAKDKLAETSTEKSTDQKVA